jgi:pilus assembly protein Flp/PilA
MAEAIPSGGKFEEEVMKKFFGTFKKEEGQGLVEYALIIALVAILLIGALGVLRGGIDGVFTQIAAAL